MCVPISVRRLALTPPLQVNTIPGIEEVNIFFPDDKVIHFKTPKGTQAACPEGARARTCHATLCSAHAPRPPAVQASIAANTYVVSGSSATKSACPALALLPTPLTRIAMQS